MPSAAIPQCLAGFSTLTEGLDYAAKSDRGLRFYTSRGQLGYSLSYYELQHRAVMTAKRLRTLGLVQGSRIGLIASTSADFLGTFYGCQYAGLIPCPLPHTIYLGGRLPFIAKITQLLGAADSSAIITSDDLEGPVRDAALQAGTNIILTYQELANLPADGALSPLGPGDVAYIQFSSGSTSAPKGVLISQGAILANARGILREAMRLTPDDRALSWLPFYHDMGLVGFSIAPMLGQCPVDYLAASSFARRPALWLGLMSQNRTTITYAPTFGYELAVRRVDAIDDTLDLSSLRIAGIGGDMIRADILQAFANKLAPFGFRQTAFLPSYGMAENTLAATFATTTNVLAVDVVDRDELTQNGKAVPSCAPNARRFVVCGRPLDGHAFVIVNENGEEQPDRCVGHIHIRGPSLMSGYYGKESGVPEAGILFDTGDLGYSIGNDLIVTGRAKDLILHNGRNIWPQDIEWTVEQLDPIRSGDVAAFAIEDTDGRDQVITLVQCRIDAPQERILLKKKIQAAISENLGIAATVILVETKSLPFTSSGKLSRHAARARFVSGELTILAA